MFKISQKWLSAITLIFLSATALTFWLAFSVEQHEDYKHRFWYWWFWTICPAYFAVGGFLIGTFFEKRFGPIAKFVLPFALILIGLVTSSPYGMIGLIGLPILVLFSLFVLILCILAFFQSQKP